MMKKAGIAAAIALAMTMIGCSSSSSSSTTVPPAGSTGTSPNGAADGGVTAQGISPERCAANRAAGKIVYLSSFDFSASAAIVDVLVADEHGYFADMCLDVELRPSFSVANYPLIEGGRAQFSSAGNYTEMLNYARNGGDFVAVIDYGKVPVEALVTKNPEITDLAQLRGATIGIKGDLPPSLVAMLKSAGLTRGVDYREVLLDGFDPVSQLDLPIDALPVYKTNEPGQLDAAGVAYTMFDPIDYDIPGSFGILYTSRDFATRHPSATEDFTRAALRGMEDALADPTEAIRIAVERIEVAGNENYLTLQGETFRWTNESALVRASTPEGEPVGIVDGALLDREYQTYLDAGVWPTDAPKASKFYDTTIAAGLYGPDGRVIWPEG